MRCLVFGGSGFLGSHLVEALLEERHQVLNFDLDPLCISIDNKRYTYYRGDIRDEGIVFRAIYDFMPECVYIFSAVHDIESCEKDPYGTFDINILGLINILTAISDMTDREEIKQGKMTISKVISASSMYANSANHPYGITKLAGELLLKWYAKKYNFPYIILRFGTVYGPRAGENNGLRRFVKGAIDKGVIEHYGTGREVREYIHVKDVARSCIDLMEEEDNETFVITGAESIKSSQLCVLLQEMMSETGLYSSINFNKEVKQDGHYEATPYRYKITAIKKYTPTKVVDFGSGLLELVEELKYDEK